MKYEAQRRYLGKHQDLRLFNSCKCNAKRRGIPFSLTREDIKIPETCPLLGIPLTNIQGHGRVATNASIDRKDSTKGYTKENVWIISDLANRMKAEATPEQLLVFAEHIKKVYGTLHNSA
jgi:hypothetical protein